MPRKRFNPIAFIFLLQLGLSGTTHQTPAQAEKAAYPAMSPVDRYLIADRNSEIALARSAAPASIANGAEVMVLERRGFTTAVRFVRLREAEELLLLALRFRRCRQS